MLVRVKTKVPVACGLIRSFDNWISAEKSALMLTFGALVEPRLSSHWISGTVELAAMVPKISATPLPPNACGSPFTVKWQEFWSCSPVR